MTHKNIHEAMLAVMQEVGYVHKDGKIAFGNTKYSYAGEVALIKALRPVLLKNGITGHCNDGRVISVDNDLTTIETHWNFTHAATDTIIRVWAPGQGKDSADKAIYKAMTGALKYALRQTFLIETGDDPDKESSEEIQYKTAKARNDKYKEIKEAIKDTSEIEQLKAVWASNQNHIKDFEVQDETFYEDLVRAKDMQKQAIEAKNLQESELNKGM